jgi:hypothetical protein
VQGIVCICKKTLLKPPILVGMIELLTLQAIEADWGVYQSVLEWGVYQSGQLAHILSSFIESLLKARSELEGVERGGMVIGLV